MLKSIFSHYPSLLLAAALSCSATAPAQASNKTQLALTFGDVLAAETPCNLNIDPARVERFIQQNVAGDDLNFMSTVRTTVAIAPGQFDKMPPALRSAHCTQMKRLAKNFKILSD